jgi:hypothetical protein
MGKSGCLLCFIPPRRKKLLAKLAFIGWGKSVNSSEENTNTATFHSEVIYSISVIESIVEALVSEE